MSLVFFHLREALFSDFFQFQGNFVDGQKNSKYRDVAPLKIKKNNSSQRELGPPVHQHGCTIIPVVSEIVSDTWLFTYIVILMILVRDKWKIPL